VSKGKVKKSIDYISIIEEKKISIIYNGEYWTVSCGSALEKGYRSVSDINLTRAIELIACLH